jgi:tRNA-modifying protein YgfZ
MSGATILSGRAVLEVAGEARAAFLQGLVTNDIEALAPGAACFAGLLTPQGKILFDFIAINTGDAILLDCPAAQAADLLKRLGFYKLRAQVILSDVSARFRIAAAWGEGASAALAGAALSFPDPRSPALGFRALVDQSSAGALPSAEAAYETVRVAAVIPEGGKDYAYGEAFPHEACFDLLGGVSFKKGCYVGQEVVSRMQHRGTARSRILSVTAASPLPSGGADILVEGFAIGRLGSVAGAKGIALARLDRVAEAVAQGQPLSAGGAGLAFEVPPWANYSLAAPEQSK